MYMAVSTGGLSRTSPMSKTKPSKCMGIENMPHVNMSFVATSMGTMNMNFVASMETVKMNFVPSKYKYFEMNQQL